MLFREESFVMYLIYLNFVGIDLVGRSREVLFDHCLYQL